MNANQGILCKIKLTIITFTIERKKLRIGIEVDKNLKIINHLCYLHLFSDSCQLCRSLQKTSEKREIFLICNSIKIDIEIVVSQLVEKMKVHTSPCVFEYEGLNNSGKKKNRKEQQKENQKH